MDIISSDIDCDTDEIEALTPIVVYGEAAVGKTLSMLLLARRYSLVRGSRIYLITTEPQSTLPLASRLLPADSLILIAASQAELAEHAYIVAKSSTEHDVIVVDTINGLYRLEVSYDPYLASRLLAFTAALLATAGVKKRLLVLAAAQVHNDPESGGEEPPGETVIREYFDIVARMVRLDDTRRIAYSEDGKELFELRIYPGRAVLRCKS